MTLSDPDLQGYFARIGFTGTAAADRGNLAEIARLHPAALPFENLDPLLGRPVDLSPEALAAKLIHGGRGGYCFEQNGLLQLVLERLGFAVSGLAARVIWGQPENAVAMLSHKLLLVTLPDGPVVVDVGFGGNTPTGVIDLVADVEQPTPHEPFRLLRRDAEWWLQARIGDAWRTTYRFELRPILPVDHEPTNWWQSTSPRSRFTRNLVVSRALPGRRLALLNGEFAVHTGGQTERRQLSSASEACDLLQAGFGLRLPDGVEARLDALFATQDAA